MDTPARREQSNLAFAAKTGTTVSRRDFVAGAAMAGSAILLPGGLVAATQGKKTFTILHTNDMHSAFIGLGPAGDYTPLTTDDDKTRGGYSRLAGLLKKRKAAREGQGPVLILDAGDYSMGTAFGAATRTIGGELQIMARMSYDATTFGNHEFDYGPEGLGQSIGVASKAARIPAILAANTKFPPPHGDSSAEACDSDTILRVSHLPGHGNRPLPQPGKTSGARITPQILLRRQKT